MDWLPPVLLLLALGVASAFISALEALVSFLREHRAKGLALEVPGISEAVYQLGNNRESLLGALVFLSAILNLSIAVLGFYLFHEFPFPWSSPPWLVAVLALTVAILLGDVIPKMFALSAPTTLLSWGARPLAKCLPFLIKPSEWLNTLGERMVHLVVPSSKSRRPQILPSELDTLIEMRTEAGVFSEDESEMIREILKLGRKTTKDCMTPRQDATFLDADLPTSEFLSLAKESRHRLIPIYRGDLDNVFGILDVHSYLAQGSDADLASCVSDPVFVPENANALQLFHGPLAPSGSLAVVLDEYGNVEGVVTHSNVVEEILEDVAPQSDYESAIEPIGRGRFLASGSARIDELEELLFIEFPDDGIDTIAGLISSQAGLIPELGSTYQVSGINFTVRGVRRNRIEEVLIEPLAHRHPSGELPKKASA